MACQTAGTILGMGNPCGACGVNFGCGWAAGQYKPFPATIPFIFSIAGSCPLGTRHIVSGNLVYQEDVLDFCDPPTEPPLGPIGCDVADGSSLPRRACSCVYKWEIDPGDIPACGEYVAEIAYYCRSVPYRPDDVTGIVQDWQGTMCPHQKHDTAVWGMFATVKRTHKLDSAIVVFCDPFDPDTDPTITCYDKVQSSVDCTFSNGTAHVSADKPSNPARVICDCVNCPNAWCISSCDPLCENCPDTGLCCNDGACSTSYKDADCTDGAGHTVTCGPVCGPGGTTCYTFARTYEWGLYSCVTGDEVKGLNPTCCPPNKDNTGDFFIHINQHPIYDGENFFLDFAQNCEDDWFEGGCPVVEGEMAGMDAAMALTQRPLGPLCGHPADKPRDNCVACRRWADPGWRGQEYREVIRMRRERPDRDVIIRHTAVGPELSSVGDQFKKLAGMLGVEKFEGCACESLRIAMNKLGPAGVRERMDEIKSRIEQNLAQLGGLEAIRPTRWQKFRFGLKAVRHFAWVNPRDPVPGMIRLACRMAKRADRRRKRPAPPPVATGTAVG